MVWRLALNNQLSAAPTYDSTRAYFPIDGDRIVAYTLATGVHEWSVSARPQMEPVAGEGLLFVVEPDLLTARRAADGTVAWQLPFGETLAVRPIWDNGWLVVATIGGTILAFRGSDGALMWRRDLGSPAHAPPALAFDRMYVPTEDGRVVAVRVDTGTPVWQRRLGGAPNDIVALAERLFVGSKDNFLYCLDTKDGRIEWRWRTGGDVIGLPVVDDDTVYFVSLDNLLRALARKSGVQRWVRALPLRPTAGPLKSGDTLVVAGIAPTLRSYRAKDGAPAGDLPTDGELAAPPRLIVGAGGPLPQLVVVTRGLAKGAAAMVVTRSIEPSIQPLATLPNPVPAVSLSAPLNR